MYEQNKLKNQIINTKKGQRQRESEADNTLNVNNKT